MEQETKKIMSENITTSKYNLSHYFFVVFVVLYTFFLFHVYAFHMFPR